VKYVGNITWNPSEYEFGPILKCELDFKISDVAVTLFLRLVQ